VSAKTAAHSLGESRRRTRGVAWAFLQPYRVTLLHPHGQGFWWLAIEPPLLVVLAGIVFAFLVAPSVIEDLETYEEGQ